MTHPLLQYFFDNPMRILSLIGGAGGLAYWHDRYINRPRINIEFNKLGLSPQRETLLGKLEFEVENLGIKPTSLKSEIHMYGFTPKILQKDPAHKICFKKYKFIIESQERTLNPNTPKNITAEGRVELATPFL